MQGAFYPDLKDRTVVITGGASGIGEAMARAFASQGSKVGILDIDAASGSVLVAELRQHNRNVEFVHADVRDIPAIASSYGQCF